MEDDHSRKFWAARLENEKDDTVVDSMKHLHDQKYASLLTDNVVANSVEEILLWKNIAKSI